jgi:glycosyltransferase involved in cell wall biosynthesis
MTRVARIAYLLNQHPYSSCTFIRREIHALERAGLEVLRYSVRRPTGAPVGRADECEAAITRIVLDVGAVGLIGSLYRALVERPMGLWRAFRLALSLGSRSGPVRWLAYLVEACVVMSWCRQDRVDHVHAHFGTNATTVAMLCRTMGGPTFSFTVHGPEEFDHPIALGLRVKTRDARFVAAVSSFTRSQLCRWSDFDHWHKIHVVRCGVDAGFLTRPRTSVPDTRTLVCIGRLVEQKGHFELVEAARILARDGVDFRVRIVGDGPFRMALEAAIRQHGLHHHLDLVGWLDEVGIVRELESSRALVLPSFAEGLPVVIMEAFALGRPVLATSIAGIPELVRPSVSGWLVPAGSCSALADAMREVLATPVAVLETMGRRGREAVRLRHDVEQEASSLLRLLRDGPREVPDPASRPVSVGRT